MYFSLRRGKSELKMLVLVYCRCDNLSQVQLVQQRSVLEESGWVKVHGRKLKRLPNPLGWGSAPSSIKNVDIPGDSSTLFPSWRPSPTSVPLVLLRSLPPYSYLPRSPPISVGLRRCEQNLQFRKRHQTKRCYHFIMRILLNQHGWTNTKKVDQE